MILLGNNNSLDKFKRNVIHFTHLNTEAPVCLLRLFIDLKSLNGGANLPLFLSIIVSGFVLFNTNSVATGYLNSNVN